jgi:hypothetical protein
VVESRRSSEDSSIFRSVIALCNSIEDEDLAKAFTQRLRASLSGPLKHLIAVEPATQSEDVLLESQPLFLVLLVHVAPVERVYHDVPWLAVVSTLRERSPQHRPGVHDPERLLLDDLGSWLDVLGGEDAIAVDRRQTELAVFHEDVFELGGFGSWWDGDWES